MIIISNDTLMAMRSVLCRKTETVFRLYSLLTYVE